MLKIAVVAAMVGLSVLACGRRDPRQALVEELCTSAQGAQTSEEAYELVSEIFRGEVFERAAKLGMNEEDFGQAVEARCGEALQQVAQLARAYEEARETEHRALLDQLRMSVEECTDEEAAGTITNTSDQALPDVAVTVLLFAADGTQMTSSHVLVRDLAPGETRRWMAPRAPESLPEDFSYSVARCEPLAGGGY